MNPNEPLPPLNEHRYVLNKNLSDGTMAIYKDSVQLTADQIYYEILLMQERLNAAVNQLHERMRDEQSRTD